MVEHYSDERILCREHSISIFLDSGVIEICDTCFLDENIRTKFRNLVSAASVVGKPFEWAIYEQVVYDDGFVTRFPVVGGSFVDFVNDESYSLTCDL